MFGNKSLPSRIYSYGANEPVVGADAVNDAMFKAHQYGNVMIEVELGRREKVEAALKKLSPLLAETDREIAKLDKAIEGLLDKINKDHVSLMTSKANDPQKVEAVKELKARRSELYKERADLRKKLFSGRKWKTAETPIEKAARALDKKNRAKSDIYWGTYLHVEQSLSKRRSGAPPHFKRWEGEGHLAVQIQNGMTPEEALSGEDTRLKIVMGRVEVDGSRTHLTGIKRKLGTALCHFRIGSDAKGGPIMAQIPFTMHRPLPDDSTIKWVHLIRRRIGTQSDWMLQFVVSKKKWVKEDQAKDGACGVDVGFRRIQGEGLRVAVCYGTDLATEYLSLPEDWLGEMRRTEGIRSIRDVNFNDVKASLKNWIDQKKGVVWFREDLESLSQWKSQGRLAGLVLKWREKRVSGDDEIFTLLEEWRKRDKHLYEFEANLRDQLIRRRESIYRNFAAQLRRKYRTAVLRKIDYSKLHKLPATEDAPKNEALKCHARDANLSALERCIRESMAKTREVAGKDISKIHAACGSKEKPDPAARFNTCSSCGETFDVDENAAKNLLLMLDRSASAVLA